MTINLCYVIIPDPIYEMVTWHINNKDIKVIDNKMLIVINNSHHLLSEVILQILHLLIYFSYRIISVK